MDPIRFFGIDIGNNPSLRNLRALSFALLA